MRVQIQNEPGCTELTDLSRRGWRHTSRRLRRCSQRHTRTCLRPILDCVLSAV